MNSLHNKKNLCEQQKPYNVQTKPINLNYTTRLVIHHSTDTPEQARATLRRWHYTSLCICQNRSHIHTTQQRREQKERRKAVTSRKKI